MLAITNTTLILHNHYLPDAVVLLESGQIQAKIGRAHV